MAFVPDNFNARSSLNARAKGQQYWTYDAVADLLVLVVAADYFLLKFSELKVGDIQSLSGAGAVDTISFLTEVTSTGADALTLIDGGVGQLKRIVLIVDGGTATLTPTTLHGATTIAFADAGDSVDLEFGALGWRVTGQGGLGTGPLVA